MTASTEKDRAEFEQIMRKSPAYKPELMNRIGDRYELDAMESAYQGFMMGIEAAQARVPLSDEQIAEACGWKAGIGIKPLPRELQIARAIEAAHGITQEKQG